jgi:hypothetical protein
MPENVAGTCNRIKELSKRQCGRFTIPNADFVLLSKDIAKILII